MKRTMNASLHTLAILAIGMVLPACNSTTVSDAYGNFEAIETTISAKGNGELLRFDVKEGQQLAAGTVVGLIDTTSLSLQRQQALAKQRSVESKTRDAGPQIAILMEQKRNVQRERDRTAALVAEKAATTKQLDDLNGQLEVVQKQIESAQLEISIANRGILSETGPLDAELRLMDQRLHDNVVRNPIAGTVLTTFVEPHEQVMAGTPLYKIADLSTMELRAYTSADLLQGVQAGQRVTVRIDEGEKAYRDLEGTITWIASNSEFTPKSIQTKQDRVNLVYALKVEVRNDGTLRIGMPGEVVFAGRSEASK